MGTIRPHPLTASKDGIYDETGKTCEKAYRKPCCDGGAGVVRAGRGACRRRAGRCGHARGKREAGSRLFGFRCANCWRRGYVGGAGVQRRRCGGARGQQFCDKRFLACAEGLQPQHRRRVPRLRVPDRPRGRAGGAADRGERPGGGLHPARHGPAAFARP